MNVLRTFNINNLTLVFFIVLVCMFSFTYADDDIKRIVFDEVQIEGKIRRPQLVLIKAEQRPNFSPMVMKSLDSEVNVSVFSSGEAIEKSPYSGAFEFEGERITNYVP